MKGMLRFILPIVVAAFGVAAGGGASHYLMPAAAVASQAGMAVKTDRTPHSVSIPRFMVTVVGDGKPAAHVLAEVAVQVIGKEAAERAESRLPWIQAAIVERTQAAMAEHVNGGEVRMPDGAHLASLIAEAADAVLPDVTVSNAKVVKMAVFDGSAIRPAR